MGRQRRLTDAAKGLREAAKGLSDLPDGWYVDVDRMGGATMFTLMDPEGRGLGGHIKINRSTRCGAWEVGHSLAKGGWGPFLYDVAMEYAGKEGLTPDRLSVSAEAERVWAFYSKRSDVKKIDLDTDRCRAHAGLGGRTKGTPLDYRYVKKTKTIIPKLKAAGLWRT